MAERVAGKAKKQARKAPVPPAKGAERGASDRLEALEAECARLKSELAEARKRIAELEGQREQVVNRIDWVIDSLHSLLDE
ncbi:MAG: DUF5320 domain-containing protein [Proteobacteria bacterium]|nr:DUF5320 domain-containing protein [Pseudomonadota bacterium]